MWEKGASEVVIDCDDKKLKVKAEKWEPLAATEVIYTTPYRIKSLKDGDKVKIMNEVNGKLYLRTKECHNIFTDISNYLKIHKSEPLNSKPVSGQLVMAPYRHLTEYFRAIVRNVIDNNTVILYYPDYGNEFSVQIKALHAIDEKLATTPSTLIEVNLEGFEKFDAEQYVILSEIISKNEILTVVSI